MSTREVAAQVFNTLTENQMFDFLKLFADDNTLARFESEIIANNPNRKHYRDLNEILKEIEEENDNE